MCQFFSLISDGQGKPYYFDYTIRKKIISKELEYGTDSHTSIADYYGFKGEQEDKLNKYEYNPLTKHFEIDQLNTTDDSEQIKAFCEQLDFKTIVPELIIKPIIRPKDIQHSDSVSEEEIKLLKQWASVRASVRGSVWVSVWASVGDSVWGSVWVSVWASVGASVRGSVGVSVWASVGDSVWGSVGDSVWAYISSFFNLDHKDDGATPCIDLWERGLVPSYDGKTWRLHNMSNNAKVIYEMEGGEE